jgi:hypothetical protein
LPKVFGSNPTDYWGPFSSGEIWGYVGVVTLGLAALALVSKPERLRVALAVGAAVALVYALGPFTPLHGWAFRFMPLYDLIRAPARGLLFVDLALALLAGFAVNDLSAGLTRNPRLLSSLQATIRAIVVALGAVLLFVLPLFYSLILGVNDPVNRPVIAVDGLQLLAFYLAATGILLWAVLRARLVGASAALVAVALMVVDLFGATAPFNPTPDDLVTGYRHPETVAYLQGQQVQDGRFRIDVATASWLPDLAAMSGLDDIGGLFDPMQLADYARVHDLALADRTLPLYNVLNARFLITDAKAAAPGPSFVEAFRSPEGLVVWENRAALPRAWLAYQARALDKEATFATIARRDFDPRTDLLLDRAPVSVGPGGKGTTRLTSYGPDEVRLRVETDQPGYLVLADVAYPGWQATVDGRGEAIATADGVFRAVAVPAGTHEVRFTFRPPLFRIGWAVAGVALLIWVGMIVFGLSTRLRTQRRSTLRPS